MRRLLPDVTKGCESIRNKKNQEVKIKGAFVSWQGPRSHTIAALCVPVGAMRRSSQPGT